MQIVIDISESAYETCKTVKNVESEQGNFADLMLDAIADGTVLPKHGKLIDIDSIQEITLEDSLTILTHKKGDEVDWYIDAPTILEAWGNKE